MKVKNLKTKLHIVFQTGGGGGSGGAFNIFDWDGQTNVAPTGALKGYFYRNTSNTTTLLGPDGGIIPAGNVLIALVDNPSGNIWDKTQWAELGGVWGEYGEAPELLTAIIE